ncbi:hypothetical protein H2199_003534 [Coniosporium tulheliwenetii]|uniref:Uncharacterized protein n=1 Tax=Coniosporium tulheliwenetii TaxID=3383036 RepID=A0ACC2ZBY8_9PEZI|nr:hypothetical protein H2199_003534 [Cladosporium sp. JES 115]
MNISVHITCGLSRADQTLSYFVEAIQTPHTFEELRTIQYGRCLSPLIKHLSDNVKHQAIVSAILALKGHFAALESDDDRGVNETRGLACEIVAWRFVTHITEREAIDYLLYELSPAAADPDEPEDAEAGITRSSNSPTGRNLSGERTPLLNGLEPPRLSGLSSHFGTDRTTDGMDRAREEDSFAASFESLNALEIAAVCGAKKFLSQRVIQKMINGIWRVGEYQDAGHAFYATDFWSLWDIGIVAVGVAFLITRVIGLVRHSHDIVDTSFDILALEALFLVPRICSLLSLNQYFGTLIPCLKEMTKDFVKFLSLVVILYLGFLTTFTLLARGHFTPGEMSWILIKVFFGSSYLGFDVAQEMNLIPLLLRPLRLLLPSEKIRSARIMLLKATHLPHVGAIWIYENGRQYLAERHIARDSVVSSMGGPQSATTKGAMKRTTLRASLKAPRLLVPATLVQASLDGGSPTGGSPLHRRRVTGESYESNEDLRSLVIRLSSQVSELTAMIAQQLAQEPQADQE